jgi:divalent metal cation (Fe/Co/Zn/Cd) transporter
MAKSSSMNLTRYAWLSIGAAILTISLKMGAYFLTNSVSLSPTRWNRWSTW